MRRVLDALYTGEPVPPDAQAALSEEERVQVAAIARTAHLTRLALNKPEPTAEMEAASLAKAQTALAQQKGNGGGPAAAPDKRPNWLDRLLGRRPE
jgi:hypothetical protein